MGIAQLSARRGINGLLAMMQQRAEALAQLRAAAASFRQRGLRPALNTMVAARAERLAALATMSAAATAFVNRSLLRAWRKLSAAGLLRGIAKRAARSLLHRNLRRGHNGWVSMILDRAAALTQLRAAAASFRQRGLRSALNTMVAANAEPSPDEMWYSEELVREASTGTKRKRGDEAE